MEREHWPRVQEVFGLIPGGGDYLEIGIGNGYGLAHMATHPFQSGRCLGMDISASMVERARARTRELTNVDVCVADFLTHDFGGRRFDVIFSMEVFYYFPDMNAGIRKAFAVLKPGGSLWVAVNFYAENAQSVDWPDRLDTPMQRWSVKQYVEAFEQAGFTNVASHMIDTPLGEGSVHGDAPTLLTVGKRP
jgi:ubiquinone/menaquinone biosynthesis C-methylase UbiE